jgi:phage protein D
VIADVLTVSFTDDLEAIDSFEFTLNDWDPVALRPKYSSPRDASGNPFRLPDNGPEIPNFEPGAQVALYLGYRDEGELGLIMEGEVVSISTTFPVSGQPVATVRALDAFQRGLQKTWVEGNFTGTDKTIVDQLCQQNGVTVEWQGLDDEGDSHDHLQVDGPLFDEIQKRWERYLMITRREGESVKLLIVNPLAGDHTPHALTFTWGRTLVDFTPVISAAAQVEKVEARGADPDADGPQRGVRSHKTWVDIGLGPDVLRSQGLSFVGTAVRGTKEVIKPDHVTSQAEADKSALKRMRELATTLITGSGTTVGLPELRAGCTMELVGLGLRFDGTWRLTKTTHTLGASGYTTAFTARKVLL